MIAVPALKRIDLAVNRVQNLEHEISLSHTISESLSGDLQKARTIESLARRAANIDNLRVLMSYISILLKTSPYPAFDRYSVRLQELSGELAGLKNQLFVHRMYDCSASRAILSGRAREDERASHQRFHDIEVAYQRVRSSLKIAEEASPADCLLRRSAAYARFCL